MRAGGQTLLSKRWEHKNSGLRAEQVGCGEQSGDCNNGDEGG